MALTDIEKARDAFLNMIADADVWECDVDGDVDSNGRPLYSITYQLTSSHHGMEEFLETIGVTPNYMETFFDAVNRLTEEPPLEDSDARD